MKQFNLVPGSPYPHWQKNSFSWEKHFFFSYSRHAMIEFLKFVQQEKQYSTIKLLSPQYMCHEVINSLSEHAGQIVYYPQNEDFSFDLKKVEELVLAHSINVMMVSHLYGHYYGKLKEVSELCQKLNVVLLEDIAHLPWFTVEGRTQYSHAQFFSYRKLFSIPYGATCLIHEPEREKFDHYYHHQMIKRQDKGTIRNLAKSMIREQVKKMIIKTGLEWKRHYVELGLDPLKEYNQLPAILISQLKHVKTDDYILHRRQNFLRLKKVFESELKSWAFLDFDLSNDIPYSFLFYKRQKIDSVAIINKFLSRGISAVKGLELHPKVVLELGENHPFNNQLSLPIHQDVTLDQVDHMINVCREILN